MALKRANFLQPDLVAEESPEGFQLAFDRFGPKIGGDKLGTTLYELPQGQAICPYHYEYPEEEWLLVLEGTPTLRTPAGEERIGPWEVAFFPAGPDGAHSVRNETAATVRVLMFSTRNELAVAVYPDSGKIGVFTGNRDDDVMVRKSSNVDYYDGETG